MLNLFLSISILLSNKQTKVKPYLFNIFIMFKTFFLILMSINLANLTISIQMESIFYIFIPIQINIKKLISFLGRFLFDGFPFKIS